MTSHSPFASWLDAIRQVAANEGIDLPKPASQAMGTVLWQDGSGERAFSIRMPLRKRSQGPATAIHWAAWESTRPSSPILEGREEEAPENSRAKWLVMTIYEWIMKKVSPDEIRQQGVGLSSASHATISSPPLPDEKVFSFTPDGDFAIAATKGGWSISSKDRSLSSWRTASGGIGTKLPIASFAALRRWLRDHWDVLAYGVDRRPEEIGDGPPSAVAAYQMGVLRFRSDESRLTTLRTWWNRHSMRSADASLPNIFFERQADDCVISWDSMPAEERTFHIGSGIVTIPMSYAVPALAAIADDMRPKASDFGSLADSPLSAAAAVFNRMELKGHVTSQWLTKVDLSERDACDLIRTGNTTSPVFGLLRSARGSNVSLEDIEMMLAYLHPSMPDSYLPLRKRAANLSTDIDSRRPWASGYELARDMRARMGMDMDANVNTEIELEKLGIAIHDLAFADNTIRGACVGCPQFSPAVFLNTNSTDASGVSGRRTTLAHELCHLLFDRSLMRSLARLEGSATEQDRILEMRANAFAVEFLVPMESLLDGHGNIVDDERVREISIAREVSRHALERHAQNLRRLIHSPF